MHDGPLLLRTWGVGRVVINLFPIVFASASCVHVVYSTVCFIFVKIQKRPGGLCYE